MSSSDAPRFSFTHEAIRAALAALSDSHATTEEVSEMAMESALQAAWRQQALAGDHNIQDMRDQRAGLERDIQRLRAEREKLDRLYRDSRYALLDAEAFAKLTSHLRLLLKRTKSIRRRWGQNADAWDFLEAWVRQEHNRELDALERTE